MSFNSSATHEELVATVVGFLQEPQGTSQTKSTLVKVHLFDERRLKKYLAISGRLQAMEPFGFSKMKWPPLFSWICARMRAKSSKTQPCLLRSSSDSLLRSRVNGDHGPQGKASMRQ